MHTIILSLVLALPQAPMPPQAPPVPETMRYGVLYVCDKDNNCEWQVQEQINGRFATRKEAQDYCDRLNNRSSKTCPCSAQCTCGCNEGEPCQCGSVSVIRQVTGTYHLASPPATLAPTYYQPTPQPMFYNPPRINVGVMRGGSTSC